MIINRTTIRLGVCAIALALVSPLAFAQAGTRALDRFDGNGDGAISREEVLAAKASAFDRADADSDGLLTQAEVADARKALLSRLAKRGADGGSFEKADSNGDGNVSRQEWLASPTPIFDRADANGDGVVTQSERSALLQARKAP